MEDEDNETKLNNEVSWCIDQLLQSINSGKLSERKGKNIGSKIGLGKVRYYIFFCITLQMFTGSYMRTLPSLQGNFAIFTGETCKCTMETFTGNNENATGFCQCFTGYPCNSFEENICSVLYLHHS